MHITVIGSGYVGTTIAACFADIGHEVTAIDIDQQIVDTLNAGQAPISEPGLEELLSEHAGSRLTATTAYDAVPESDVTFWRSAHPRTTTEVSTSQHWKPPLKQLVKL